jgi:hypothetical protein
MAFADTESITVTTNSSGDATAYTTKEFSGPVRVAIYTKNNYANGVDFTITGDVTGQTIWVGTDVNASTTVCPKQATHLNSSGAAALYASGGTAVLADVVLSNERIKVVVAQGGNATSGAFRFVVG